MGLGAALAYTAGRPTPGRAKEPAPDDCRVAPACPTQGGVSMICCCIGGL